MITIVDLRAGKSGIALAASVFGADRAQTAQRILDRICTNEVDGVTYGVNVRRKIAARVLREGIQQLTLAADLVEQDIEGKS